MRGEIAARLIAAAADPRKIRFKRREAQTAEARRKRVQAVEARRERYAEKQRLRRMPAEAFARPADISLLFLLAAAKPAKSTGTKPGC